MTLATYISDLLYRYECVIIPNFGGFISNPISAKVNHFTHTFCAPTKQLSFNSNLKNNDGLLTNYIASAKKISYTEAQNYIACEVLLWKKTIQSSELEIEKIGSIKLNNKGQYLFEPNNTVNYLTSSFGLTNYVSPAIKRQEFATNANSQKKIISISSKDKTNRIPNFIKYAASAAILFAIGSVSWNQYQQSQYNNLVAKTTLQQQQVEKTIQEATFVISNPLPTITLNVAKETFNYHIIAGAFRNPANAEKKLKSLLKKGYNAKILGLNKWNLTQVAYESFNSRIEAVNKLNTIKKEDSKFAWLLVKEY